MVPDQVLRLAVCITVAFWVGCGAHDRRAALDTGAEPVASTASGNPILLEDTAEPSDTEPLATIGELGGQAAPDRAAPDRAIAADRVAHPVGVTAVRADWAPVRVVADQGRVPHRPIYFHDYHLRVDRPSPLAGPDVPVDEQARAALRRVDPAVTRFDYWPAMPFHAAKGAFDLATLPVRVVVEPPWTTVE